jgi:hypothetical protein
MPKSDINISRQDRLIKHFSEVRLITSQLCSHLKAEDFVAQPTEDVSPPKWHLGHTSWFFETFILEEYKRGYQPYNPHYNYIFNSYYESSGNRVSRNTRGNLTRPTTDEIVVYREYVDNELLEFLDTDHGKREEMLDIFELGINHEQQHQELLLCDIKFILGHNLNISEYTVQPNPEYSVHTESGVNCT